MARGVSRAFEKRAPESKIQEEKYYSVVLYISAKMMNYKEPCLGPVQPCPRPSGSWSIHLGDIAEKYCLQHRPRKRVDHGDD